MKIIRVILLFLKWKVIPDTGVKAQQQNLIKLLQKVADKDRNAFELLYDQTVHKMYSLAFRISQSSELAEEVVNDVYLQVWQQADRFDASRGNVLAWMTMTCRSRALDALRRRKKSDPEHSGESTTHQTEDNQPYLQDILEALQNQLLIRSVLQQLDSEQRQLLALAYFKGYSHQELADFTNTPLGTIKSQLRRTLQTLKQLMTDQLISPEQAL
ncbi:MAG: sigma-70 family RNA polymerase sigma factor [Gammaproteobacteria bacterium]|nr:sigma-70 family RNA polymerase sigma factor [Gammaproteobacteria bacterium]